MAFSVVGFGYKVQFGKETFRQHVEHNMLR